MSRSSATRIVVTAGALVLALLLSACGAIGAQSVPAAPPTPAGPFSAGGLQDPSTPEPQAQTAPPTRVQIPAIGVDTALEDLAIDGSGRLAAPVDFDLAGWYSGGVVPGQVGPAIIAGHVDSPTAPAVFADIGALSPGDDIVVTRADGTTLTFTVSGSTQSAKAEFPTDAVYSNVPAPELRLITCGGIFDSSTGHYLDNLIVFAELRV
ncbi:class F sortase [Microbacterium foliorum]|uniref:Sortase family protein n=1 Tax=Microbacterium foliorum TaxID=104336 RepID=A0A0F0KCY4_9MICO|nr:class F sortase [Microbacterium foliorum]AXL11825.1 class F sortase [Microbacterium foliorum]KJL18035.1 Sortase family protein [Microbacterium foliorum]